MSGTMYRSGLDDGATVVHSGAMQTREAPASPWRAWRETIPGLSMNEVARRAGINSGRLSIIERGVVPTELEADRLRAVLIEASAPR
jgi:hypothetical protein